MQDLEITGHPVLKFQMSISSKAGAVFAYLQDLSPDGKSYFLTDSQLNLRDRKITEPQFDNLGLPYHSIRERDRLPVVPNEVMEACFALNPVSWVVPAGHRLCLTITGADLDNFHQHRENPPPRITIYCNASRPMTLVLPVVENGAPRGAIPIERAFENLPDALRRAIEPTAFGRQSSTP